MDLFIDGCPLQTQSRDRGIGRYTSCLLATLRKIRPNWKLRIIEHTGLPSIPAHRAAGLPIVQFTAPLAYDLDQPANYPVNDLYFGDWLNAAGPDHVLFTSVFEKLGVVPRFTGPCPSLSAMIYDLIPILFPGQYGVLRGWGEGWYGRRFRDISRMDRLFAISAATAADTRRLLGTDGPPVVNVRGAVDSRFIPIPADRLPQAAAAVNEKYGIKPPFLLYIGAEDYRKNLYGMVTSFAALPPEIRRSYQVVITCKLPSPHREEVARLADRLGVGDRVICTGFVPDEDLIVLYQTCRLFLFPSLYEGLGLPVLEALLCGAPVACSNCSSMPEFAGNFAEYFDPRNPESMVAAITESLSRPRDEGRVERERFARSFRWEETAEAVAAGIEAGRRTRQSCGRLAWVSASAPDNRPGRLDSEDVLSHLARGWDVAMVLPDSARAPHLANRGLLLAPQELAARAAAVAFDLYVLNVGAGNPAPALYEAATRAPTLVVLSDPRPSGYRAEALRPLLTGAAAVAVASPEMRVWARTVTDAPVLLAPREAGAPAPAAVWLDTAIREAAARVSPTRRWMDAAVKALSDLPAPPSSGLLEDWARLRSKNENIPNPLRLTAAA
jgi:glycosyltransferase involved in cell wall biosynthesis